MENSRRKRIARAVDTALAYLSTELNRYIEKPFSTIASL